MCQKTGMRENPKEVNERISFCASNRCLEIIQQTEKYWYVEEFHLLIRMKCFNQAEIKVESRVFVARWRKYNLVVSSFNCYISVPRQLSAFEEPPDNSECLQTSRWFRFYSSKSHFKLLSFSFPFIWLIDIISIIHNFMLLIWIIFISFLYRGAGGFAW